MVSAVETAVSGLTGPGRPFEMREVSVHGASVRAWAGGARTLREIVEASAGFGDATFLVLGDERTTFAGHLAAVEALAQHLVAARGIRAGDRVAIAMRNLPEWSIAFWATVAIGAVAVPLNAWWTREELAFALGDSGARVAIVDDERARRLGDGPVGAVEAVLVARPEPGSRWPSLTPILAGPLRASLPAAVIDEDAPATLFYTSGTTGHPKGVVGTHRNMVSNLLSRRFYRELDAALTGRAVSTALPTTLLTVPLFHVTGAHSYLLPALASGSTLVLMPRWNVEAAITLIERERVTALGGVPFMALQLLDTYRAELHDLSSLTAVTVGGAMAPPDLVPRLAEALPNVVAGNGYGMTETSSVALYNYGDEYRRRPAATGRVVPIMDAQLVREDGTITPHGPGELWLRGGNVVPGYWHRPEETAATFRPGGWLRTGDLATIDDDGIVTLVGRRKEVIVRGGENIAPAEVVDALMSHRAVRDAAVVGVPDRLLGEQVGAVVQVDTMLDAADLRRYVGTKIASFKVPVRLLLRVEPVPRSPQGKIVPAEIRALLEDAEGDS